MMCRYTCLHTLAGVAVLACAGLTHASVVMTGTRVIYPARSKEQTIQFRNPDAHPHALQVWMDDGDRAVDPDTDVTPFLVLPPVFRIEPEGGQVVRLLLTGTQALPQDRESVFYLNFSQLPVRQKSVQSNQLLLMFTSRVKVFYRPVALDETLPADIAQQLQFAWQGDALRVRNPTAYHAVVTRAEWGADPDPLRLAEQTMIAPFAEVQWPAPGAQQSGRDAPLRLTLRNDYGADVTTERALPTP